jgi:hypothetical protein
MKQTTVEKQFLRMAGEYGVCAELQKRHINANVAGGVMMPGDIFIFQDPKIWYVEVKTTKSTKFITGFFQKFHSAEHKPAPDFWVLVHINSETFISDFYVLTHEEMAKEQMKRNKMTEWQKVNGVDSVEIKHLNKEYLNNWKIIESIITVEKTNCNLSKNGEV